MKCEYCGGAAERKLHGEAVCPACLVWASSYAAALEEWHRCVAAEESNPEAFGLADMAMEAVRVHEARLSEPDATWIRQEVEAAILVEDDGIDWNGSYDEDDYYVVEAV